MKIRSVSRIGILYFGIIVVALILLSRLFVVQIVRGELYAQQADGQYVTDQSYVFDRGTIYFEKKDGTRISSATLRSGYILAIDPSQISNISYVYKQLSSIVNIEKDIFFLRAGKKDDPYEEIVKRLDKETAQKIEALDIKGVVLAEDKWRFYPGGDLSAHAIGFVGYKGNVLGGRYGLERYYDDILSRGDNKLYVNFFAEVFSNVDEFLRSNSRNNRDGDIVTTIELSVQGMLEESLLGLEEKWNTDSVGGIIIDPRTGSIYALASRPGFDPNYFNKVDDISVFTNPLVENVYEMGSIMKPLTMATGLDTGVVTYDSTYKDDGYVVLDGLRIENYDGMGRGVVPMQEVLNQSLNTGAVHVMQKVGKENFKKYMYDFGL
ncbi:MAG: hypothetical protein KAI72_01310, partial [Candidatus Pacebacteria bacterium]|nr:hypothetical protein [Candidatus Paceibacterota bacterium]